MKRIIFILALFFCSFCNVFGQIYTGPLGGNGTDHNRIDVNRTFGIPHGATPIIDVTGAKADRPGRLFWKDDNTLWGWTGTTWIAVGGGAQSLQQTVDIGNTTDLPIKFLGETGSDKYSWLYGADDNTRWGDLSDPDASDEFKWVLPRGTVRSHPAGSGLKRTLVAAVGGSWADVNGNVPTDNFNFFYQHDGTMLNDPTSTNPTTGDPELDDGSRDVDMGNLMLSFTNAEGYKFHTHAGNYLEVTNELDGVKAGNSLNFLAITNGIAMNRNNAVSGVAFDLSAINDRGFGLPKLTITERDAISIGASTGVMIYNTTSLEPQYWNGVAWQSMVTPSSYISNVVGTTNRITVSGSTTKTVDISSSYVGQSTITTLGTIGTGTWNGTVIGSSYGGAGTVNGIMKANGSGTVSAATAGTDYIIPSGSANISVTSASPTISTIHNTNGSGVSLGDGYLTVKNTTGGIGSLRSDNVSTFSNLQFPNVTSSRTIAISLGGVAANTSGNLTETDPVFSASSAFGITGTNISNWNTAFGWGNHASAGYLTDGPHDGVIYGRQNGSWVAAGSSLTGTAYAVSYFDNAGNPTSTPDFSYESGNLTVNNGKIISINGGDGSYLSEKIFANEAGLYSRNGDQQISTLDPITGDYIYGNGTLRINGTNTNANGRFILTNGGPGTYIGEGISGDEGGLYEAGSDREIATYNPSTSIYNYASGAFQYNFGGGGLSINAPTTFVSSTTNQSAEYHNVTTIAGDYTVLPGDNFIACDTYSGTYTVDLPAASVYPNRSITVYKGDLANDGGSITLRDLTDGIVSPQTGASSTTYSLGNWNSITSVTLMSRNNLWEVTSTNSGTGFAPSTSGTSILKGNGSGGFSSAVSGTDYAPPTSGSSLLKGNGSGGFSSASSGTDYAPPTATTSILKGNGSGGFTAAAAGTDYVAPNGSITGATKTKITYDSKGLVTTGTDLVASDLPTGIDAAKINTGVVSNAEFNYLDNVTSAIQTQIDSKQATVTGAATTITGSNLTTSRALVSDGSGKVAVATTTATEIGYLNGVTSAIQTQINTKDDLSSAAYTFHANNTNATANQTDQTFKSFQGLTYAGTVTWTSGTTDPSGTPVVRYSWQQVGKVVFGTLTCYYPTAGTGTTSIVFTKPTDMPDPYLPTGTGAANDVLYPCSGFITTNYATVPTVAGVSYMKVNAAANGYEFRLSQASSSARYAVINFSYQAQ